MDDYRSLDALVRARLKRWPQRPPGLTEETQRNSWLRGRPTEFAGVVQPFLKFPGSDRLRTLPDGLWLNFGGTPEEPFADVFAIEACSSLQNLLDKRSRFAPSTHSMLAVCPIAWLLAPLLANDPFPRWKATGVLREAPVRPLDPAGARHPGDVWAARPPLPGIRPEPGAASARVFRAHGSADTGEQRPGSGHPGAGGARLGRRPISSPPRPRRRSRSRRRGGAD